MPRPHAVFAASVVALFAAVAAPTAADATQPVELRLAVTAPPSSVWAEQLQRLALDVAETSGGSVRIVPSLGGRDGSEVEIVRKLARGELDMASAPLAIVSSLLVPELQVLTLPLYYRDEAEQDCVLDTAMTGPVAERLARQGVHFIGWGEAGSLYPIGKRPFASPADLAGTVAGTFGSRQATIAWEALGAARTEQLSSPTLADAFRSDRIDVAWMVPTMYVSAGINRAAPVIVRSRMGFAPTVMMMHKPRWDALTDAQRAAIASARSRRPHAIWRREVREFESRMFAAHEAGGGRILESTAAQQDAFRSALAPAWPRMVAEAGAEGPSLFAQLEAARAACARGR
jgi:TRAP-type C4-dicarboxylate transport system substrate-binding protein